MICAGRWVFVVVFLVVARNMVVFRAGYVIETGVDFLCIVFSPFPY